jgi:SAM-dependent methyltransferase
LADLKTTYGRVKRRFIIIKLQKRRVANFISLFFCERRKLRRFQREFKSLEQMASADLTRLPFPDSSVAPFSCMHVVEHIGLGRYGDPLDYDGDLKAMAELRRVLAPGGSLLFVVPVGRPVIRFNAHRIYAYSQIRGAFPDLALKEFTLIPDSAGETGLMIDCDPAVVEAQNYACGCFLFKRESTGAAL